MRRVQIQLPQAFVKPDYILPVWRDSTLLNSTTTPWQPLHYQWLCCCKFSTTSIAIMHPVLHLELSLLDRAHPIFRRSTPSNLATTLPLPTSLVDASVHNISFVITSFDCFTPTRWSLKPSLKLEIILLCNFTDFYLLRNGGIIPIMILWLKIFRTVWCCMFIT
jgi:hypothetical protein